MGQVMAGINVTGKDILKINYSIMGNDSDVTYNLARMKEVDKDSPEYQTSSEKFRKKTENGYDYYIIEDIGEEYEENGNKAIFYYIADERVDFRQLIKVLAETFRVRIEMKQIGARQEAGRIGGIGPCGRELCCATWMTNFVSVSTSAARYQDISLNPQKLAGQCAKLKCCLNYEVDAYVEAQKRLPSKEITLETVDGTFYFFKADILKGSITYSTDKNFMANIVTIPARRAFEIINMNRRGEKPENLLETIKKNEPQQPVDLVEQESLTRFDKRKGNNNNRKKKRKGETNGNNEGTTNGNKPQQLKDNQPKGEGRPPKGENRAPKGENRAPKGENRASKGEGRPPKGEGRPPRENKENRAEGKRNREDGRERNRNRRPGNGENTASANNKNGNNNGNNAQTTQKKCLFLHLYFSYLKENL